MYDLDESEIEERVAAGTEWLDANAPGWEKRVSLPQFDIKSVCRCVLGQVFAQEAYNSTSGFDYVVDGDDVYLSPDEATELGFDMQVGGHPEEYKALQAEWERVIASR